MKLNLLSNKLAAVRMEPSQPIPEWAKGGSFCSITITPTEMSIFCESELIPEGIDKVDNWRAFQVDGQLDFELSGIIAQLAVPLSAKQISIFSISTYDTDYILVENRQLAGAIEVLKRAGHNIHAL